MDCRCLCRRYAADEHLSLFGAGVLISAPTAGLLLTLIAWGALADRTGERLVIAGGLGLAALFLVAAVMTRGPVLLCVLLVLAGASGASVNAASGRVVMGWFAVSERGLAMGIRQTAQPLGVAIAAVTLPAIAHTHGVHVALLPALLCASFAVAILLVADPPRPAAAASSTPAASPYRVPTLWRIHAASALLVIPQFAVSAFTLTTWSANGTGIQPSPGAWYLRSRSPVPLAGSRRASGRMPYAAGSHRCVSSR